ncbi:MAG: ATP-dependent zinc metalloprotease FtsH [Candidatus Eisenbacteria bacterium]|nr:ATP-dependent zinc metalloprotease FtsH [Candidatus Eisenbacteria bacterium]
MIWIIVSFIVYMGLQLYFQNRQPQVTISNTRLLEEIQSGNIASVDIVERHVTGKLVAPSTIYESGREVQFTEFESWLPFEDPEFLAVIREHSPHAEINGLPPSTNWGGVLFSVLPLAVIVIFWIFIMRTMRGGGPGRAFSFGKSGARLLTEDRPKVTFDDVAGLPEAKQELQEIVEFLREPKKFQRLGGRIPKGALLVGPPGTGKTLLARAVAGEAGVPFLSISGSDFVEMFVGVGAARVRDLFEQGKTNAPCIIFIDEMDAVGRMRGAGLGGGHDEREQTLNQLLVEMDGFESNEGVILLAATNRPDVLDPALMRPGRFDRQIVLDRPDLAGRKGILGVSARDVTLAEDVDFDVIARGTPGLSGADLANLVNEAALLAARVGHKAVEMEDFEEAKDKIMLGIERKSVILSDEEIRTTAYHEAGHALVSWLIPGTDPIHKVTIIPRGHALGITHFLPVDERHNYSKQYWVNMLTNALGGRAAERLALDDITTGAAQDIDYATEIARRMVCEWGMSNELGPVTFGKEDRQVFLGRELGHTKDYSESTAVLIDKEIRALVDQASERAEKLLSDNLDKLHLLAENLLERETLTGQDLDDLFEGISPSGGDATDSTDTESPGGAGKPATGDTDAPGGDGG